MAVHFHKAKKQQARSLWGTRLLLLCCAVLMGAMAGYSGTAYLLSLRRDTVSIAARRSEIPTARMENGAQMDLNRADAEDLQQVRGIGPALAQAIVDYRDQIGGFHYIEEVLDVSGIGAERFAALNALFFCPRSSPVPAF